jgi:hypothetical protein
MNRSACPRHTPDTGRLRSSKGHFVKTSGLRWLSLMVAVPIPWAGRTWALPFLTVLAPSARWSEAHGKRRKTLTIWARQAILQTRPGLLVRIGGQNENGTAGRLRESAKNARRLSGAAPA